MIIRINSNLPSVFKDTRKGIQIHRLNHYAKLERNNDLNLKMDVGENFSFLLDKPTLFYVNFYNKFWLSDYTNKGVISNFGLEKKKLLVEWPIVGSSKANEAMSFREGCCCGMVFLENDLSSSLFSKLHRDRPILYKFKVFKATLSLQAVML